MSNRIKILDEGVINRIAAGEVVDRPVSVVKELVENSIDAGATSIRIDVERGGKKLIRVRDNGCGMSHDDAFLSIERHATSKLTSEKDLIAVATLGFRGEALASIASVSKLRLVTSDGSEDGGTEILIEGGILRKSQRVGAGKGTLVEVNNLFYNVPVRLKFLKENRWEADLIDEFITKLALAFPDRGFSYSQDNKIKLDAPPVKSTFERVHALHSKEVRDNLVAIDYSVRDVRLHGYVAKPPFVKSNMRSVFTFVNGRPIKDRLVNSSVMRAFSNLMERGRYPLAMLFLEMPPEQVDVNVHPQKAEVRFRKPKIVSDTILNGIHEALMGAPFSRPPGPREPIFPVKPYDSLARHLREETPEAEEFSAPDEIPRDDALTEMLANLPREDAPASEPASFEYKNSGTFSSMGILGHLPNSFVVLYTNDDLVVLDHHAAHERLLFDRLMALENQTEGAECQVLLIPTILEYPAVESRALAAHLSLLRKMGFMIEEFGERSFVVKGVPGWYKRSDLEEFFSSLIEVMMNTGLRGDPSRLKEELLKDMACKAAVKEPTEMKPREIRALLEDLENSGAAEVCPHGRPFTVRFSLNEIRRKMGRK